nr:immunoglobulin heavy chain junction region [Macaca mulatta]MOY30219.1 immunoglobulin heavy chain junction region [Macaca mulatta]
CAKATYGGNLYW